ncbi:MAG: right-handed parallel beta-helix repeat-containing protein, partial [Deltaproteobacteria bacterium]|nr:right-handed parallel beta-helix repeat-containing protein [Deltaproteobacteria bacterium]
KGNRLSGGNYGSYSTIMNEEGEYVDVPEPNYEAGIKLQGSGETGPEDTEIGEISGYLTPFSYNKYGIHVDGVKGRTFIRGTGIYGSTLCGVLVANMSESVSIGDSSLWGNYKGLCVEDSENVSTGSNHIDGNMIDGTSIVRSHKISLEGDLVQTNKGDGIHIEESSAIAMSGLKVQYNEKNGIVIEKPPSVSKGAMTIGESPSGTQALKKRITRIDAMNPLPFDDNDAMKNYIYGNKENGVYIHSGARDVGIKFSEIAGNDAGGVRIEAAGENISVESSIIGKTVEWAPMSDNFGGVIILDSEGAVRIGGANRGNLISGNASHGVFIKDSGNVTIEGNYIGSDMSGLDANANFGDGIHIEGSHAIDIGVGGLDSANLISGNKLAGIYMDMEGMLSGNRVEGNFIK